MIYYFVDDDGMVISEEEQHRGYFTKKTNPNMFITKKGAIREAKKQIQQKIKEMSKQLKEYEDALV